jgi:hypothetical protein
MIRFTTKFILAVAILVFAVAEALMVWCTVLHPTVIVACAAFFCLMLFWIGMMTLRALRKQGPDSPRDMRNYLTSSIAMMMFFGFFTAIYLLEPSLVSAIKHSAMERPTPAYSVNLGVKH